MQCSSRHFFSNLIILNQTLSQNISNAAKVSTFYINNWYWYFHIISALIEKKLKTYFIVKDGIVLSNQSIAWKGRKKKFHVHWLATFWIARTFKPFVFALNPLKGKTITFNFKKALQFSLFDCRFFCYEIPFSYIKSENWFFIMALMINLSPNPEKKYFSDIGMNESIL